MGSAPGAVRRRHGAARGRRVAPLRVRGGAGRGPLAARAERVDGRAPLLGRREVAALAQALEHARELGGRLRIIDGEVGRRIEQPLAAWFGRG